MSLNLNFAKRFAADKLTKHALDYIQRNPEENFPKILDIGEKLAKRENHKDAINVIRNQYQNNPVIKDYLQKLSTLAPSYKEGFLVNFLINSALLGIPCQYDMAKEIQADVPWTILIDPTSACNLNCEGCWAGEYDKSDTLKFDTIDRIITEAKEMGIYFIVLSGGEPTLYPDLFKLFEKHNDVSFMMYTNGTLIDNEFADKLLKVGNVTPAISLEGFKKETDQRRGQGTYDKIMNAMDRLKERGIIFGASVTATRNNIDEIFSDKFIEHMINKGAMYMWSFHYIPIGRNPNLDLMLTPKQRYDLANRVDYLRSSKPLFIMDFWNDGRFTNGCIAGGRRYFHINAKGEAEPCAFAHFSVDNIKNKSLKEILQNPLFKSYQKRQPFNNNQMCPCPIIDNPKALREIVNESNAKPTHPGADNILSGDTAKGLDIISKKWQKKSQDILSKE